MKKEIKKFWQGKISLGRSFWLWYVVGGTVITLPGFLVPDSALESDSAVIIFILYVVFMLVAIIFLMIGSYKSAQEYKKIKRKKKQGSGWGTAAQVYIILSAIRGFVEMIKIFQS
jgi:hypothetical protein